MLAVSVCIELNADRPKQGQTCWKNVGFFAAVHHENCASANANMQ